MDHLVVDLNYTLAELSSEYDVISASMARTETIEHFLLNQEIRDRVALTEVCLSASGSSD